MIVNIRTVSWSAQLCRDSPIVANSPSRVSSADAWKRHRRFDVNGELFRSGMATQISQHVRRQTIG
jgi:hypothetical protein